MTRRDWAAAAAFLLVGQIAATTYAQIPGLAGSANKEADRAQPVDALGRDTLRGTIVGFSRAVERDDISTAARWRTCSVASSCSATKRWRWATTARSAPSRGSSKT